LAAARRARDALLADERREKESSQQQRLDHHGDGILMNFDGF